MDTCLEYQLQSILQSLTAPEDFTRVRTEFLSISKCPHLTQIAKNAFASLKDLKTLTLNGNPELKYIAPNFIQEAPNLAALDLSQNR